MGFGATTTGVTVTMPSSSAGVQPRVDSDFDSPI